MTRMKCILPIKNNRRMIMHGTMDNMIEKLKTVLHDA